MSPQFSTTKPRVLAIDDEKELLAIIKTALEDEGYAVVTTESPDEGIRIYTDQWRSIDLVLLDFMMPGLTGDLVFECLQRVNPYVRVLLLTACDDHVARGMFEAGLRGFIQKPFYLSDLIGRVAEEVDAP